MCQWLHIYANAFFQATGSCNSFSFLPRFSDCKQWSGTFDIFLMHLRDFSIVNEMIDPSLYKLMCKRFTFEFKVLKTDLKLFGILPFAFESLQIIR